MRAKTPIGFIITVIAVVALMHAAGYALHLYWRLAYYDRVVHVLAALWVATVAVSVWRPLSSVRAGKVLAVGLTSALAVGIAWELFELAAGLTSLADGAAFWRDAGFDLAADLAGGAIGSLSAIYRIKKTIRI